MSNCPCPLVVYEWHPSVYILTGGKNSGDATLGKIEQVKLWFYKLPPAGLPAGRKIQNDTILEKIEKNICW